MISTNDVPLVGIVARGYTIRNFSATGFSTPTIAKFPIDTQMPVKIAALLFIFDVSNELCTPLTGLRSIHEVSLSDEQTVEEHAYSIKMKLNVSLSLFWRHDKSRAATGIHAGLGMSIAKAMAHNCNLETEAQLVNDAIFQISLSGCNLASN